MKYLLGLLMVLSLSPAFSQSVEKAITEGFTTMSQAMAVGDFAKAADYMGEELFNVMTKEQFVGMLDMMMNNPQLEIEMAVPDITSISEVMEVEGKFYAILETKSVQKLRFFDTNGQVAKLADSPVAQQTHAAWKTQLGEENVAYDEESGFFTLSVSPKALAISSDGKTSWKFLTVDESSRAMIKQIIPEAVMSKL